MEMTTEDKLNRLIIFYGLGDDRTSRLLGVLKRHVHNFINGTEPVERINKRIDHVLEVLDLEVNESTPENRLSFMLSSSDGMSLFHRLVDENPEPERIHYPAYSVAQMLGVDE